MIHVKITIARQIQNAKSRKMRPYVFAISATMAKTVMTLTNALIIHTTATQKLHVQTPTAHLHVNANQATKVMEKHATTSMSAKKIPIIVMLMLTAPIPVGVSLVNAKLDTKAMAKKKTATISTSAIIIPTIAIPMLTALTPMVVLLVHAKLVLSAMALPAVLLMIPVQKNPVRIIPNVLLKMGKQFAYAMTGIQEKTALMLMNATMLLTIAVPTQHATTTQVGLLASAGPGTKKLKVTKAAKTLTNVPLTCILVTGTVTVPIFLATTTVPARPALNP